MLYQSKVVNIEAVQFSRANHSVLRSFLGENFKYITNSRTPDGISYLVFELDDGVVYQVDEGYYVIKVEEGKFSTMSEFEFERKYEKL